MEVEDPRVQKYKGEDCLVHDEGRKLENQGEVRAKQDQLMIQPGAVLRGMRDKDPRVQSIKRGNVKVKHLDRGENGGERVIDC